MATKKTTAKPAAKAKAKIEATPKPRVKAKTAAKPRASKVVKPVETKKPADNRVAQSLASLAVLGRWLRKPAVIIALVTVAVAAALLVWGPQAGDATGGTRTPEQYQRELQAQVEQTDGAPSTGRDPAAQGQNSLASAASKPTGNSQRSDTPASSATVDNGGSPAPANNASGTGIGTNGCFIDYGIQGEQCLPAHAAGSDKVLDCSEVTKYFRDGIKVVGTDRFGLDHDGDKMACTAADSAHAHSH